MHRISPFRVAPSLPASILVVATLLIAGCDVFGSESNDAPVWVGDWEVVDAKPDSVEYPPQDTRIFFSISTDSIKTYVKFVGQACSIETTEIVSVDGNVVTTEGGETDETETRLDVSGNTLTVTPLGSEAELEEVTAESVDDNPAEILNCSSSGGSGAAERYALDRRLWLRE